MHVSIKMQGMFEHFWALKCTGFSHTSNKRLHILHTFTGFIGFLKASLFRDTSCYEHCIPNLVWHHHDFRHFLRGIFQSCYRRSMWMCWWHCSVAVAPPKTRIQNNPTKFEFHGGGLRVSFFFEQTCFRHRGHRFTRFWFWLQQWICRISTQQKANINLDTPVSAFLCAFWFFFEKWSHILIQLQDLHGILPSDLSRMTL